MAYRRKDIVGKRFLCVPHEEVPRRPVTGAQSKTLADSGHSAPANWKWRAGLVRAATHTNLFHNELQVFIDLLVLFLFFFQFHLRSLFTINKIEICGGKKFFSFLLSINWRVFHAFNGRSS